MTLSTPTTSTSIIISKKCIVIIIVSCIVVSLLLISYSSIASSSSSSSSTSSSSSSSLFPVINTNTGSNKRSKDHAKRRRSAVVATSRGGGGDDHHASSSSFIPQNLVQTRPPPMSEDEKRKLREKMEVAESEKKQQLVVENTKQKQLASMNNNNNNNTSSHQDRKSSVRVAVYDDADGEDEDPDTSEYLKKLKHYFLQHSDVHHHRVPTHNSKVNNNPIITTNKNSHQNQHQNQHLQSNNLGEFNHPALFDPLKPFRVEFYERRKRMQSEIAEQEKRRRLRRQNLNTSIHDDTNNTNNNSSSSRKQQNATIQGQKSSRKPSFAGFLFPDSDRNSKNHNNKDETNKNAITHQHDTNQQPHSNAGRNSLLLFFRKSLTDKTQNEHEKVARAREEEIAEQQDKQQQDDGGGGGMLTSHEKRMIKEREKMVESLKTPSDPLQCRYSESLDKSPPMLKKYGPIDENWCEMTIVKTAAAKEFYSNDKDNNNNNNNKSSMYFNYKSSADGVDWKYYQCPVKHRIKCKNIHQNNERKESRKTPENNKQQQNHNKHNNNMNTQIKSTRSRGLVIFILTSGSEPFQYHQESVNLLFFLEHGLIPANTSTALFDSVDFVFAKLKLLSATGSSTSSSSNHERTRDCGKLSDIDKNKNNKTVHTSGEKKHNDFDDDVKILEENQSTSSTSNVRFLTLHHTPCDLCAHAKILDYLGVMNVSKLARKVARKIVRAANNTSNNNKNENTNDGKRRTEASLDELFLIEKEDEDDEDFDHHHQPYYSHVFFMNNGVRGPFFNTYYPPQKKKNKNKSKKINNDKNNNNDDVDTEANEPPTTWLDYIAMGGRKRIPNPRSGFFSHKVKQLLGSTTMYQGKRISDSARADSWIFNQELQKRRMKKRKARQTENDDDDDETKNHDCPIHISSSPTISWDFNLHHQSFFIAQPIEMVRRHLFPLFANTCPSFMTLVARYAKILVLRSQKRKHEAVSSSSKIKLKARFDEEQAEERLFSKASHRVFQTSEKVVMSSTTKFSFDGIVREILREEAADEENEEIKSEEDSHRKRNHHPNQFHDVKSSSLQPPPPTTTTTKVLQQSFFKKHFNFIAKSTVTSDDHLDNLNKRDSTMTTDDDDDFNFLLPRPHTSHQSRSKNNKNTIQNNIINQQNNVFSKFRCILLGETQTGSALLGYGFPFAMMSMSKQMYVQALPVDNPAKFLKYFHPPGNPVLHWMDPCKAIFVKDGGEAFRDKILDVGLIKSVDMLTLGMMKNRVEKMLRLSSSSSTSSTSAGSSSKFSRQQDEVVSDDKLNENDDDDIMTSTEGGKWDFQKLEQMFERNGCDWRF